MVTYFMPLLVVYHIPDKLTEPSWEAGTRCMVEISLGGNKSGQHSLGLLTITPCGVISFYKQWREIAGEDTYWYRGPNGSLSPLLQSRGLQPH